MGFWDDIASVLSGGASDVVKGDAPFTEVLPESLQPINTLSNEIINPMARGWDNTLALNSNDINGWEALDRTIDLPRYGSDQGAVDYGLRETGEALPENLQRVAPSAGAIVGGIVGSYVPVLGTAVGAAIGRGVGGKLQGESYGSGFKGAGTTYAVGSAMQGIGKLSDAMAGEYGSLSEAELAGYAAEDARLASQGITDGITSSADSAIYGPISEAEFAEYAAEDARLAEQGITDGGGKPMPYSNPEANLATNSIDWKKWLMEAGKLGNVIAGGFTGQGTEPGPSMTYPGKASTDAGQLSELMGRDPGKRGLITSEEAMAPGYGATLVNQRQIEKYNPQQLYYS